MAPEHPPGLVIFDSRFEDGKLRGDLHYIEAPVGQRLRVRWDAEVTPENFQTVGRGVAYVFKDDQVKVLPISHNAIPDDLGSLQYRWSEGLNFGIPWIMFVVILPNAHTLTGAFPRPARAKVFGQSLALYWILKGDDFGRTNVICALKRFHEAASSQIIELNRLCLGDKLPPNHSIEIEDKPAMSPSIYGAFNVFLSHNSKDKPIVRRLGEALMARGLRVWLDEWELVPGRPWQEALEEITQTTTSAAVLVGAEGLGPWELAEMRGCLSEFVSRKLPVIPVLLPGAPKQPDLPLFLRQFTWVDLRSGLTADGLDRLIWGITGVKPVRRTESTVGQPPTPIPDSGPLQSGALRTWKEKLQFLQEQEAITADPSQKFALKKQMEEAKERISELGGLS